MLPPELLPYPSYAEWLRDIEGYAGQLKFVRTLLPHPPRVADYHGDFAGVLEALHIAPYGHQVEAFKALEAQQHLVTATSTASGKSLIFQVPVLKTLLEGGTAILLYPTKALAHDQLLRLRQMADQLELEDRVFPYDGDTPEKIRQQARANGRAILTNPDMLHFGLLPRHAEWADFLSKLRYVVIDELHAYRGVFGTHTALILRRLLRLALHYGANPQVVAASATIANPAEHAESLTGLAFKQVDAVLSRAEREFGVWVPKALDKQGKNRRSANLEAALLARYAAEQGLRTLVFTNARRTAELVSRYAAHPGVQPYRAGYTAKERRRLEEALKSGQIKVLVSTSALELGLDIGGLDAVVLLGYPGSLSAFWQRAGRAGRGEEKSLVVWIPRESPMDEYFLERPELFLGSPPESAVADPDNPVLYPAHAHCAARELPIALPSDDSRGAEEQGGRGETDGQGDKGTRRQGDTGREEEEKGGRGEEGKEPLTFDPSALQQRPLTFDLMYKPWLNVHPPLIEKHRRLFSPKRYPHGELVLRGLGSTFTLKDNQGKTLGILDERQAYSEAHPGAVYLHMGENYLVRNLDVEHKEIVLLPGLEDYYTQPRAETDLEVISGEEVMPGIWVGPVISRERVTGYVKKRFVTEVVLEEVNLMMPELSFQTEAVWWHPLEGFPRDQHGDADFPEALVPSAIHALEHTLIGLLPLFVLAERQDVGGVSYPFYPRILPSGVGSTIFVYDGYPGGVGYARAAARKFPQWIAAARDLLEKCPCDHGCPRCVLSPKCGNGNQYLDKKGALMLAEALSVKYGKLRKLN